MQIRIESDASAVNAELARLARLPDPAPFDAWLAATFSEVEAFVHVITGALKASGRMGHDATGDHSWEGHMTWGGPSPVMANRVVGRHRRSTPSRSDTEVVYAWYEMRRGGTHDYLRGHSDYEHDFGQVVAREVLGR